MSVSFRANPAAVAADGRANESTCSRLRKLELWLSVAGLVGGIGLIAAGLR